MGIGDVLRHRSPGFQHGGVDVVGFLSAWRPPFEQSILHWTEHEGKAVLVYDKRIAARPAMARCAGCRLHQIIPSCPSSRPRRWLRCRDDGRQRRLDPVPVPSSLATLPISARHRPRRLREGLTTVGRRQELAHAEWLDRPPGATRAGPLHRDTATAPSEMLRDRAGTRRGAAPPGCDGARRLPRAAASAVLPPAEIAQPVRQVVQRPGQIGPERVGALRRQGAIEREGLLRRRQRRPRAGRDRSAWSPGCSATWPDRAGTRRGAAPPGCDRASTASSAAASASSRPPRSLSLFARLFSDIARSGRNASGRCAASVR